MARICVHISISNSPTRLETRHALHKKSKLQGLRELEPSICVADSSESEPKGFPYVGEIENISLVLASPRGLPAGGFVGLALRHAAPLQYNII